MKLHKMGNYSYRGKNELYPEGCEDIQIDIPNDELIRRLKVLLSFNHVFKI
jgi:hypothetical protein